MDSATPRRALRNLHLNNVQSISTPLKIPASPFMKSLGYGTGVNVYRLERSPKFGQFRSPLALKRVSSRTCTPNADLYKLRILKEAEILRHLSHPNIVGFRGIATDEKGVSSLVLECCKLSLGTILEERHENKLGPLLADETLKMIYDIACGLDYLHTEAKILHGDIKSFNVLVKGEFEICKLCDFGVSLPLDEDLIIDFTKDSNLQYVGTNLWSAPEVMDSNDIIDCKADIFSFGLVIYETIALLPPHYEVLSNNEDMENSFRNLSDTTTSSNLTVEEDEDSVTEMVDSACGTRPPLPQAFQLSDAYNPIVEIFYCCTNELPEDRPFAKTIWQSLQQKDTKFKERRVQLKFETEEH